MRDDDWRVRVKLHEHGVVRALSERIDAGEVEQELHRAFHDRVVVSVDGPELFCYAGTRDQANRAREIIDRLIAENGWEAEVDLRHWHPEAEEWEDPDAPLPAGDADFASEHRERIEQERAAAAEQGYPDWEVRVECADRERAQQLGDQLRTEGLQCVQRFRYLLLGATDEDSGRALAERIRGLVPAGTPVALEGTGRSVMDGRPGNPFAVLGGLGGDPI